MGLSDLYGLETFQLDLQGQADCEVTLRIYADGELCVGGGPDDTPIVAFGLRWDGNENEENVPAFYLFEALDGREGVCTTLNEATLAKLISELSFAYDQLKRNDPT